MFDLLFRGAEVYDGSGSAPVRKNVAVLDGKIAAVGCPDDAQSTEVIDGRGLSLAPGFIDSHTHSDTQLYTDPSRWCKLKQGVTTEVGGQCGWSAGPVAADAPEEFVGYSMTMFGRQFPASFRQTMENLSQMKLGANQASFVGFNYLRGSVIGMENREPTQAEIDRMCALTEEAMQAGALGFSTGLVYAPGIYGTTKELVAIAKTVRKYGGKYTTHIRNEADDVLEAVDEALHIGQESGVSVNISHVKAMFPENFAKVDQILERIDKANASGMHVTFDVYPYPASSATMMSTLPPSYLSHGIEWLKEHLQGKENLEILRRAIYEPTEHWENPVARIGFENHLIAAAPNTPDAVGLRISEYAQKRGISGLEAYAELFVRNNCKVTDIRFCMSEENIEKLYAHPMCMVGSDGLYRGGGQMTHVRAFTTFTKYLSDFIRDRNVLPFEEGIRRITGMPAEEYGLAGKGFIREGYDADLVLFDKDALKVNASYADPFAPNEGIRMVFVNGKAAVVENELTGVLEGRQILRSK